MIGTSAYSGGVFSGSIDGGRAGAEIELSDAGIFARTNDGQTFLLPYDQCQIEIGGFSGKMIFCRNPDRSITIFSEDRNFKEALARASSGLLAQQIDQQHGQQRSRGRRSLWLGTLLLVSIV